MQSSKEYPGEIRKPSSVINVNKQRKTIEWERLEISSRKQRHQGNISCKGGHNKGQKWYRPKEAEGIKKSWQEYIEKLQKRS